MNTVQKYAPQRPVATSAEPTAQPLPTLQAQLETLQNVVLTIQHPTFRRYYGYTATATAHDLQNALTKLLGEIDPVVLEAIASHELA